MVISGAALEEAPRFPLRLWLWECGFPQTDLQPLPCTEQDQESPDPTTSPEPISVLQTASLQAFLETSLDPSSPQHVVAIQNISSCFCSWQTCSAGQSKRVKAEGAVQGSLVCGLWKEKLHTLCFDNLCSL